MVKAQKGIYTWTTTWSFFTPGTTTWGDPTSRCSGTSPRSLSGPATSCLSLRFSEGNSLKVWEVWREDRVQAERGEAGDCVGILGLEGPAAVNSS